MAFYYGNFNKYLHTLDLINITMSEEENWIEQVYVDKKTNKPVALFVYPTTFMKHYIYFDEKTCKELYSDPLDSTFYNFGINWFIYNGISDEDTVYGRNYIAKELDYNVRLFREIKNKIYQPHNKCCF